MKAIITCLSTNCPKCKSPLFRDIDGAGRIAEYFNNMILRCENNHAWIVHIDDGFYDEELIDPFNLKQNLGISEE